MSDLLITGVHGQLGKVVAAQASHRRWRVTGHDIDTLDITDPDAVAAVVAEVRPQVVINCAAFTAVDRCEQEEELATAINGTAVGYLAAAAAEHDALLVQISTDYVFAGDGKRPYREQDPTDPINAYGRSKLRGERAASTAPDHLILRTAWLSGHGGDNFIEAIRRQLNAGAAELRVVDDQTGSPTFCDDLARMTLDLVEREARGVVNAVNSGITTWHGLAVEISRLLGSEARIVAVPSSEYPRPAARPTYSVLDTGRLTELLGAPPPPWQEALARYLEGPCAS